MNQTLPNRNRLNGLYLELRKVRHDLVEVSRSKELSTLIKIAKLDTMEKREDRIILALAIEKGLLNFCNN